MCGLRIYLDEQTSGYTIAHNAMVSAHHHRHTRLGAPINVGRSARRTDDKQRSLPPMNS
jgi:hypothetical protein